jgi:hypothetical protein
MFFSATVLQASLEDLMMYAKNHITLVEAKCEQEMLADNMPEATSQAIALSEVTGCVSFLSSASPCQFFRLLLVIVYTGTVLFVQWSAVDVCDIQSG